MKNILEFVKELRHFRERATSRKGAIIDMWQSSSSFNEHLIKLLIFGWSTDWTKTVYDIAFYINNVRLKPNSKSLSEALIKEHLFEKDITNIFELKSKLPAYIRKFEYDYAIPVKRRNVNEIAKKYDELKSSLIRRITRDNGLLRSTVYNEIKSVV